ncbi:MAG: hypothetical protein U1E65_20640 [Myxococcota bacterium]
MVAISSRTTTNQAADAAAAQRLQEVGGTLENGTLKLPPNVSYRFEGDSFVLGGTPIGKDVYDRWVTSIEGGKQEAKPNGLVHELVNTSAIQLPGGLTDRSRGIIDRLFPEQGSTTSSIDFNKLTPEQQSYLTHAINYTGTQNFEPDLGSKGWSVQRLRDALVTAESDGPRPMSHFSPYTPGTPEEAPVHQIGNLSNEQVGQFFRDRSQGVADTAASEQRQSAVRDSIIGLNPQNQLSRGQLQDYLSSKNVPQDQIDQVFMPAFDGAIDKYRANINRWNASMGNNNPYVPTTVSASDLYTNPAIVQRWPI